MATSSIDLNGYRYASDQSSVDRGGYISNYLKSQGLSDERIQILLNNQYLNQIHNYDERGTLRSKNQANYESYWSNFMGAVSDQLAQQREEEENSVSNQVAESKAAGLNADLTGVSDNAGFATEGDPASPVTPRDPVADSQSALNFGTGILGQIINIATNLSSVGYDLKIKRNQADISALNYSKDAMDLFSGPNDQLRAIFADANSSDNPAAAAYARDTLKSMFGGRAAYKRAEKSLYATDSLKAQLSKYEQEHQANLARTQVISDKANPFMATSDAVQPIYDFVSQNENLTRELMLKSLKVKNLQVDVQNLQAQLDEERFQTQKDGNYGFLKGSSDVSNAQMDADISNALANDGLENGTYSPDSYVATQIGVKKTEARLLKASNELREAKASLEKKLNSYIMDMADANYKNYKNGDVASGYALTAILGVLNGDFSSGVSGLMDTAIKLAK